MKTVIKQNRRKNPHHTAPNKPRSRKRNIPRGLKAFRKIIDLSSGENWIYSDQYSLPKQH